MDYQEIEYRLVDYVHEVEGKYYPIHDLKISTAVEFAIELVKNCSIPHVVGQSERIMTETQLRKEAEEFAKNQMQYAPQDCSDLLEEKGYMIEYLTAKLLGKDPYKCFCNEDKPLRRLEDGTELCCECEKPIE